MNGMDKNEPKGVVYLDIPRKCEDEAAVVKALKTTLGWSPDQVIDSEASLDDVLEVLSRHTIKFKKEYGKIPVLIIDNANRLAEKHQTLLNLLQDYAKDTTDKGRVTVVFVSSEGHVPRRMMGKSIMFIIFFGLLCADQVLQRETRGQEVGKSSKLVM